MADRKKTSGDQRNIPPRIKKLRRIGFLILGLATAYLTAPMLWGAFTGLAEGRIWDPYTDELLEDRQVVEEGCLQRARVLIEEASKLERLRPAWENPMTEWKVRCPIEEFPESHRLIDDARESLRSRDKKSARSRDSK